MSDTTEISHITKVITRCLLSFSWGNYGLNEVDIGLQEDPEAQEWVPDLADEIADVITRDILRS